MARSASSTTVSIDWIRHSHACSNLMIKDAIVPVAHLFQASENSLDKLTDRGVLMARYTGDCIRSRVARYDICVCSFLPRAIQTAMILLHGTGKVLYVVPGIHEIAGGWKFDKHNRSPFAGVRDLKRSVNAFRARHSLRVRVNYTLLPAGEPLDELVPSPAEWFEGVLPRLLRGRKGGTLIGAVSHGKFIRQIISGLGYDLSKILKGRQEHPPGTRRGCFRSEPMEGDDLPNTSVWNQVLRSGPGGLRSIGFHKYYVPPAGRYPFFPLKSSERVFEDRDIQSCGLTRTSKRFLRLRQASQSQKEKRNIE